MCFQYWIFTKHWTNSSKFLSVISLSVHQGWEGQTRVIVTYPESQSMWIYFSINRGLPDVFQIFFSFLSPKSLPVWRFMCKRITLLSGGTVSSSTLSPPPSLSPYIPSVCLSFPPIYSPLDTENHFFFFLESWFITLRPEVSLKSIYLLR